MISFLCFYDFKTFKTSWILWHTLVKIDVWVSVFYVYTIFRQRFCERGSTDLSNSKNIRFIFMGRLLVFEKGKGIAASKIQVKKCKKWKKMEIQLSRERTIRLHCFKRHAIRIDGVMWLIFGKDRSSRFGYMKQRVQKVAVLERTEYTIRMIETSFYLYWRNEGRSSVSELPVKY